jgi:hypothetical protein
MASKTEASVSVATPAAEGLPKVPLERPARKRRVREWSCAALSALLSMAVACGSRTGLLPDESAFRSDGGPDADGCACTSDGGQDGPSDDEGAAGPNGASQEGAAEAGCSMDAGLAPGPSGCVAVEPPRLVAPLSTSTVTSQRPTLKWELAASATGAHVEICRDRGCSQLVTSFDATGATGAPTTPLSPGVLFWRAFGTASGVQGRVSSPVWQFTVGARSAPVDTSWGTVFDSNGDGYADLLVGARDVGTGAPGSAGDGHAYVYLGGASGLEATPSWTVSGPESNSEFGDVVTSAGDVNGDGFADALVSAPGTGDYQGSVYVYFGGPSGLSSSPATVLSGEQAGSVFGMSASSAGDVNGDGYADVIVGAEYYRGSSSDDPQPGRAYLYLGSATGLGASPALILNAPDTLSELFGATVASAGDLNGDGYGDVFVLGTGNSPMSGGFTVVGKVYEFLGGPSGLSADPDVALAIDPTADFVSVARAGDLNGDGYADVVVGAEGAAFAYFGGAGGLSTTAAITFDVPEGTSGTYEYRVAFAGDVNGDGYGDFLASYDKVYVYLGGPSGPPIDPVATFAPTSVSPGIYGYYPVAIGDIDGDGYDDVGIGNPFYDSFAGEAFVYEGSASGLMSSASAVLTGSDGPGGEFSL